MTEPPTEFTTQAPTGTATGTGVPVLDLAAFRASRREMTGRAFARLDGIHARHGPADPETVLLVYLDRFWIERTARGYRLAFGDETAEVRPDALADLEAALYGSLAEWGFVRPPGDVA